MASQNQPTTLIQHDLQPALVPAAHRFCGWSFANYRVPDLRAVLEFLGAYKVTRTRKPSLWQSLWELRPNQESLSPCELGAVQRIQQARFAAVSRTKRGPWVPAPFALPLPVPEQGEGVAPPAAGLEPDRPATTTGSTREVLVPMVCNTAPSLPIMWHSADT